MLCNLMPFIRFKDYCFYRLILPLSLSVYVCVFVCVCLFVCFFLDVLFYFIFLKKSYPLPLKNFFYSLEDNTRSAGGEGAGRGGG